jgi:hypothetical protein
LPAADKETRGAIGLLGADNVKFVATTRLKVAQEVEEDPIGHARIELPFTLIVEPIAGTALLRVINSCCAFIHAQVLEEEEVGMLSKDEHKNVDVPAPM